MSKDFLPSQAPLALPSPLHFSFSLTLLPFSLPSVGPTAFCCSMSLSPSPPNPRVLVLTLQGKQVVGEWEASLAGDRWDQKDPTGDFPGGPVVKTPHFHCRGARVRSLVRELRSRMLHGAAKKKKKKKDPTGCEYPDDK